jgi:hypothetical protein
MRQLRKSIGIICIQLPGPCKMLDCGLHMQVRVQLLHIYLYSSFASATGDGLKLALRDGRSATE